MIQAHTCFLLVALTFPTFLSAADRQATKKPKPEEHVITEDINLPNIDGNQLAGLFEKFSGKKITVTQEAAAARFNFVQEASKENPITSREAADLVRKSAILENFTFTDHPTDPQTQVLAVAQHGTTIRCGEIRIYHDETPLPKDDGVITYLMTLRHIETKKAMELLNANRDKSKYDGSIAAVPHASAIVITDKVSTVRKLIDLQSKFDQPSSNPKQEPKPRQVADELRKAWQGRVSDASGE